jgi:hypothetical protein
MNTNTNIDIYIPNTECPIIITTKVKVKAITTTTTTTQSHFRSPNLSITSIISNVCLVNEYKTVLEIGTSDFKQATHKSDVDVDDVANFPQVDYTYCRHVVENIQNPEFVMSEIIRVSQYGGYIETPSPLIEITKNIDTSQPMSELYCGYIQTRYIVWSNIQKNEIYFLPKYSCVLDHMLTSQPFTNHLIHNYPVYWNNYFIFNSRDKPRVIMYKNGVDFTLPAGYIDIVCRSIEESIANTNYFIETHRRMV